MLAFGERNWEETNKHNPLNPFFVPDILILLRKFIWMKKMDTFHMNRPTNNLLKKDKGNQAIC